MAKQVTCTELEGASFGRKLIVQYFEGKRFYFIVIYLCLCFFLWMLSKKVMDSFVPKSKSVRLLYVTEDYCLPKYKKKLTYRFCATQDRLAMLWL